MIYHELLPEWYGSPAYSIKLRYDKISCLGWVFPPGVPLPFNPQAIKELHLSLPLTNHLTRRFPADSNDYGYTGAAGRNKLESLEDRRAVLEECLSAGQGRLQRLRISLRASARLVVRVRGEPEALRKALEWNLGPLKAIMPSKTNIEVCIIGRPFVWTREVVGEVNILAMAQEFLKALEIAIRRTRESSPYTQP